MNEPNLRAVQNGQHHIAERVELHDKIVIVTAPEPGGGAEEYEFEVIAIVEDSENGAHYAICFGDALEQYIVTDEAGRVIEKYELAQSILDDFERQLPKRQEGN